MEPIGCVQSSEKRQFGKTKWKEKIPQNFNWKICSFVIRPWSQPANVFFIVQIIESNNSMWPCKSTSLIGNYYAHIVLHLINK